MKIEKINVETFFVRMESEKQHQKYDYWDIINFLKFNKPGTNAREYMKQLLLDLNQ